MNTNISLLSCPSCGGEAEFYADGTKWGTGCQQCALGFPALHTSKENAAEQWNAIQRPKGEGSMIKIISCAIKMQNGVILSVEPPKRHHHIFIGLEWAIDGEQGFLTSEGKFVDRVSARAIAEKSGQIVHNIKSNAHELFSERLW